MLFFQIGLLGLSLGQPEILTDTRRSQENRDIRAIAWSPRGEGLAIVSSDIRLLSAKTLKPIKIFGELSINAKCIVFVNEGSRLVSGHYDGTIRIWNVETGKLETEGKVHAGPVNAIASHPHNPSIFVSGGHDATLHVWSVKEEKPIKTFRRHREPILSVVMLSNGAKVASGDYLGSVYLWETETGKAIADCLSINGLVTALASSRDGSKLYLGSNGHTLTVWDTLTMKKTGTIRTGYPIRSLCVPFHDQHLIVAGGEHTPLRTEPGKIAYWNGRTLRPAPSGLPEQQHRMAVYSMALSPDLKVLATGGADGSLILWDVNYQER